MKQTRKEELFNTSIENALKAAWLEIPDSKETLVRLKALLIVKGKEYRRGNDPYHNFKQGANIADVRPMTVLYFFRLKHKISVADLMVDFTEGREVSLHQINEKCDDILVYTLIELAFVESEGESSFDVYQEFLKELSRKINFINQVNARD